MSEEPLSDIPGTCPAPLDLGRAGWDILHSSAAVYPYKPTKIQQDAMQNFILSWSQLYACNWCAYHMRQYVQQHPPQVQDKLAITRYVCELHNEVNERLGKDVYDCDPMKVLKRWHPGYPNKMEDQPSLEERFAAEERRLAEEKRKKQSLQDAQEARLTVFGWQAGRGRKDPEAWRASPTPADAEGAATAPPPQRQQQQNEAEPAVAKASSRWWFFGGSAYAPGKSPSSASSTPSSVKPAPVKSAPAAEGDHAGAPVRATKGKVSDAETDVDAVLARLRGCQVYCPEDEETHGVKPIRR